MTHLSMPLMQREKKRGRTTTFWQHSITAMMKC